MTTSPNVLIYSAIDGWRRQMVRTDTTCSAPRWSCRAQVRDEIERSPGLHVLDDELLHDEASHDLDPLHVIIDVVRARHHRLPGRRLAARAASDRLGLSDHRRVEATMSMADDQRNVARLLDALDALVQTTPGLDPPARSKLPSFNDLDSNPSCCPATRSSAPTKTSRHSTRSAASRPNRSPPTRPESPR